MRSILAICIPVLFITFPMAADSVVEDVVDVLMLVKSLGEGIFKNYDYIAKYTGLSVEEFKMPREKRLLEEFAKIRRNIDNLEMVTQRAADSSLSTLLRLLPQNHRLDLRLHELSDLVARVSVSSNYMAHYSENPDSVERVTLENFAHYCVSHEPNAIPGLLERIHTILAPDPSENFALLERGILHLIIKIFKESPDQLCSLQQSPYQLIYNMYTTITLTEVKGYAMMQFSWMLLRLYGKGNFTMESNIMRQRFQERSAIALASVKAALGDASREIWRCDPSYHVEGETFVALTRLLQGYVENEVDMNSDNTCKENCAHYNYAKNYGCFKDMFCSKQPSCSGKILNCRYIDSDMWVCPASPRSSRRYEWIEYENGRIFGQKGTCRYGTTKVDSWWRWLFWHCSYCMCVCDQPDAKSDRFFSLQQVVSNVANNKVVTGLRFVKVNRIIHLQISEGTLLPRGKIDPLSVRWVNVEPLDVKDPKLSEGIDIFTMSYEERSVDLDDLFAEEGHLVTGVRFKKIGSHLNFEIQISPFNFTTGNLVDPEQRSFWVTNDNTDVSGTPRTRMSLDQPDIPTRSRTPSIQDSVNDQFIQFTHTDFDADAAQNTVPFIDSQPVTSLHPVPLSGAGIYHKGRMFYGGFIAPKVFTYDYTKHMIPVFPVVDDVVN